MKLRIVFILSIVTFVFSCRQIPEEDKTVNENISLNNPVLVKINFLGTEYVNEFTANTQLAENQVVGGGGGANL